MLGDYNLELISRPYRGMKIEGNEINYRFCYMDSICYYNHKVKMMDVFLDVDHKDQMEGEEREAIAKMVFQFDLHAGNGDQRPGNPEMDRHDHVVGKTPESRSFCELF